MTTAVATVQPFSYLTNLARAADNLFGAVFTLKASQMAECLREARDMNRIVREEGSSISPSQMKKLRAIVGAQ